MNETASKHGIESLRGRITAETRVAISAAVDPLQDEMADFRRRLTAVEFRPASGSDKRQCQMLNSMGPVQKRIAFIGLTSAGLAERVRDMQRSIGASILPISFTA
eukprot:8848521-Pyramimonas_sp.AAC.1